MRNSWLFLIILLIMLRSLLVYIIAGSSWDWRLVRNTILSLCKSCHTLLIAKTLRVRKLLYLSILLRFGRKKVSISTNLNVDSSMRVFFFIPRCILITILIWFFLIPLIILNSVLQGVSLNIFHILKILVFISVQIVLIVISEVILFSLKLLKSI